MAILLTGGAGYIGSHTAAVLVQAGHEVGLHREAGWHAINLGTGRGMRSKRLLSLLRLGHAVAG